MTHHLRVPRGLSAIAVAAAASTVCLMFAGPAGAAAPVKVQLATVAQYSVLGSTTVTNTGNSILSRSLGLSPGTSITGFPPGIVLAPGTINKTNAAAATARADLTAAYIDAAGRPIDATTAADLANRHLQPGVYAAPSKGALQLTGPLVLDGAGDPKSVFIFQTDSSLTTASSSTVSLVNGAQECNVFWQVGSSATLGSGSVFSGNIMALTSISVNSSVVVHGRALARNGAVTLIGDVFVAPTCATTLPPVTTAALPASTSTTPAGGQGSTPGSGTAARNGVPGVAGPPRTDATPLHRGAPWLPRMFVGLAVAMVATGLILNGRRVRRL